MTTIGPHEPGWIIDDGLEAGRVGGLCGLISASSGPGGAEDDGGFVARGAEALCADVARARYIDCFIWREGSRGTENELCLLHWKCTQYVSV